MSISKIQGPTNSSTPTSGSSQATAFASNVASGNLLIAAIGWGDAATAISTVSDSLSQTWSKAGTLEQGNGNSAVFYYFNGTAAGADTLTVTWASSVPFPETVLWEFKATNGWVSGSSIVDATNQATGTTANGGPGNVTTGNASDLIFALLEDTSAVTAGAGGSWVFFETTNTNGTEYDIVTSTGTYSPTFTVNAGNWAATVVSFKETGGTTTLNATWTSNPHPTLTMNNRVLADVVWTANPRVTLTLNDQVLRLLTMNINPHPSLSLLTRQIQQPTVNINPKATLTLSPKGIATVGNLNPYGLSNAFWGGGYTQ